LLAGFAVEVSPDQPEEGDMTLVDRSMLAALLLALASPAHADR